MGYNYASRSAHGRSLLLAGPFLLVSEGRIYKQIAALPLRKRRGKIEVLLITSRETKRWVIPKGWPMEGLSDWDAAKQEALEEAGVMGRVSHKITGQFEYKKRTKSGGEKHCRVDVYALKVFTMKQNWLEQAERTRCWFPIKDALEKVEDGLRIMLGIQAQKSTFQKNRKTA
jgi:8-oxo-dGTP pyrophosphatase MutT (NUDIX family)